MRLFLVRHAQSTANEAGKISGVGDPDISPLGVRQAVATGQVLARILAGRDIAIYSSPSQRAFETARLISAELGEPDVVKSEQIAEMDYGEWEGRDLATIGSPTEFLRMFSMPTFSPPGGESVQAVATRCGEWIAELLVRHTSGTVVAVTHLAPVKVMAISGLDAELRLFPRIRVGNASITRLSFGDEYKGLISLNESQHLAGIT